MNGIKEEEDVRNGISIIHDIEERMKKQEEEIDQYVFDDNLFCENIERFNNAAISQDLSLTIESISMIVEQIEQDPGSDPDFLELCDQNLFLSNCMKCLTSNNETLINSINKLLGNLSNTSCDFSELFFLSGFLENYLDIVFIQPMPPQILEYFLFFIGHLTKGYPDSRKLTTSRGILAFFSSTIKCYTDPNILDKVLECIQSFFEYENISKSIFAENDFSDGFKDFSDLLSTLNEMIVKLLNDGFFTFELKLRCSFVHHIIDIFNTIAEFNAVHLLELSIPFTLYCIIVSDLPSSLKLSFFFPILTNIRSVVTIKDENNFALLNEFFSKIDINVIISFVDITTPGICENALVIIERYFNFSANFDANIYLEFFEKIIHILLNNSSFKMQKAIVNMISLVILKTSSSDTIKLFSREEVVDLLIEYYEIPEFCQNDILPALAKIKCLLPEDEELISRISQVLEICDGCA